MVARGDLYGAKGDFDAADKAYLEAGRMVEAMPGPENAGRAVVLQHRADMLERRGLLTASVVEFQKALGISPLRQHAGIYHRCAAILARLGRAPEALDYLQKGLALNDEALSVNRLDPTLLRTRVWLLIGFADLYRMFFKQLQAKPTDSRVYIERAIVEHDRLRAMEPFNQQLVRDWALMEHRAASSNLVEGRLEEAVVHAQRSVEAAETLMRLAPDHSQTEAILGISLVRHGKALAEAQRLAEAEAVYARGRTVLESAAKRNPADSVVARERYYLARDYYTLEWEKVKGEGPRLGPAMASLEEAIRMNAEMLRKEPKNAILLSDRSELHSNLGQIYLRTGKLESACAELRDARKYRALDPRPIRASEKVVVEEIEKALPGCK